MGQKGERFMPVACFISRCGNALVFADYNSEMCRDNISCDCESL